MGLGEFKLLVQDAQAITFRPRSLPSSQAARPVPPAAPSTAMVSPGFMLARSSSACSAVRR